MTPVPSDRSSSDDAVPGAADRPGQDPDRDHEGAWAGPGTPDWPETLRRIAGDPPSPRRGQLHRTGDALRAIVHRLHGSRASAEELATVADELEQLAGRLDGLPGGSIYEGFGEATLAGKDTHAFFDHSPMLGQANPLAPPLRIWEEDGVMHGAAVFGTAYEGPPGCVHGGYVAAAFDEVLGSTQSMGDRPGMTARLTVQYRSPTPLHTELRFAGRLVTIDGRKTFTAGTVHAGDRLCAEAEALFVAIDLPKMMELRRQREERLG